MNLEFTPPEKRLLIVFFALDPTFQQKVKGVPSSVNAWNPLHELPYRAMWKAIDSILTKSGKFGAIPPEIIYAEMSSDPDASPILNSSNMLALKEIQEIMRTVSAYKLTDLSIHLKCVLVLLQRFFDVRMALAEANKHQDCSLADQADILRNQLSRFKTMGLKRSQFMLPTMPIPSGTLTRVPFGMEWLDNLLGGGMADGDAMLFVAPSGGGKTVAGTNVAWCRAMCRMHAVYCSYEQEIDSGDILLRYFAMATGHPRKEFEGKNMSDMPIEIQQKFQEAREAFGQYTHLYDMSGAEQGFGGIADYYEILNDLRADGIKPTLLVVDWVQTAVLRFMAAQGINEMELTQRMDTFAREFAMFCRDQKVQGVLLQQLDTANQRKKGIEPHHTLAAKCKSMGNYMRYAVGLGRMGEDGYGRMFRTKANTLPGDNATQLVRLNGDLNRFEEASSDVMFDARSNSYVRKAEIPSGSHAHSKDR